MGEKIFIYMQELKYDIRISVISIRDKVIGTANAIVAYCLCSQQKEISITFLG